MSSSLLPQSAFTKLHQPPIVKVLNRHQSLPSRRDLLYQIESGFVRSTTVNEDGKLIVLGYWGAGDVVGHALSEIDCYQIECLTQVEVSLLTQPQWDQAVDALVKYSQQLEKLLYILSCNPNQQKLWNFFSFLGQRFGVKVEQGRLIPLILSHEEIADTINVTRVTVTRLIQQFEQEGLLLRSQRQLILLD